MDGLRIVSFRAKGPKDPCFNAYAVENGEEKQILQEILGYFKQFQTTALNLYKWMALEGGH